jgi:ABC-2 type transport system ATP-binding protein
MIDSTPALQLRALRKAFGRPAVDGIDLSVRRGELYALLGPNGAGKTTTLRMVTGLLAPDSGQVEVLGIDLAAIPARPSRRWPTCRTTRCCTGS